MKSFRLAAFLVIGSFSFLSTAFSQVSANNQKFEFSTSTSMINAKSDGGDTETVFNIPLRLGFFIFKGLEVEPEINLTIPEESEDMGYFINLNLAYNFRASEKLFPFILAGGGYGNGVHIWGFVFDREMGITALNLGAGIKILVGDSAALRLEYRFSRLTGQEEKTSGISACSEMIGASYSCLMASAGFAVAALTDWKLKVNRATARAEMEARRNGPIPRPDL